VNPLTVGPGTHGVVGNGAVSNNGAPSGTDDTAAFQTLLNAGDIIVQAGTYAIAGNINVPTNRVIQCQAGATFLDTQSSSTVMFHLGVNNGASYGHNSISGCTFEGTNVPTGANNYGNYLGGLGGYSLLMQIGPADEGTTKVSNINIQNNTFKNGQGDAIMTYSPCGNGVGTACAGATPGTEGPQHITIANNTFQHCAQPGIHINGGQYILVANNSSTDCGFNQEMDDTLQVSPGIYFYNNMLTSSLDGQLDAIDMSLVGTLTGCATATHANANGQGCWSVKNTVSGCTNGGHCSNLYTNCPGSAAGYKTGNYWGNVLTGGATVAGCATDQFTTPYCNGGTCTTTGWLANPPTQ
jgi:hypothetical protein